MNRARLLVAALVLSLAGCGDTADQPALPPHSAAASTAAAAAPTPTPSASNDRATCRAFSAVEAVSTVAHLDPSRSQPIADAALLSAGQDMRGAGLALDATLKGLNDPDNTSTTKEAEVSRAWRYVAEACISLYGDGPW